MKLFLIAALIAVAAAAPAYPQSGYGHSSYGPNIAIVRASDERHGVQSSNWSYEGSDGTTRQESQQQKGVSGYGKDSYGSDYNGGTANQGSVYWVSPEGQRLTLNWVADERGFLPQGDHLPVAPALPYTLVIGNRAAY